MRAVAGSLGIAPLDLPWSEGPRLWRTEVIDAHLPFFKDYAPVAGLLAKAGLSTNRNIRAGPRDRPTVKGALQPWRGRVNVEGQSTAKKPTPPYPPPRPPGLALDFAAANVNLADDRENRGNIIDAVVARLRGTDLNATAPIGRGKQQSDLRRKQHGRAWRGAKKLAA
ncbi:MAG: hypothetical protein ACREDT_06270 [Methylocella sp.]